MAIPARWNCNNVQNSRHRVFLPIIIIRYSLLQNSWILLDCKVRKRKSAVRTQSGAYLERFIDHELLDMKNSNSADKDKLSSGSRLLQKVNEAMNIPDPERAARIQLLKKQVQNGTYKVDADKVAQSMLRDLIKDLL